MYLGNKIYPYILGNIDNRESVSSSHWNYYHKNFKFDKGKLNGLIGFGHNNNYIGFFSNWVHFLFQKKYKRIGSNSQFFKELNKKAISITKSQKRTFGLDVLRQTLTLDFLNQKKVLENLNRTVVIGDGYGSMTTLLYENHLSKQIFLINLRKTLLVDLIYLEKFIGRDSFNKEVVLINKIHDIKKIKDDVRVIAIEAENYEILRNIEKDLVINIASFQEMDMAVIDNYFEFIYNQKTPFYFYLCNREAKHLPDGSLISFKKYKFNNQDEILTDELCPWHNDFYTFKPPFIREYDGTTRHQLRKINFLN